MRDFTNKYKSRGYSWHPKSAWKRRMARDMKRLLED